MPLPSKPKRSLREAELSVNGAELALSRSSHFCTELASQSQGRRQDAAFLEILLLAALDPSLRPSIAAEECLAGFANAQSRHPYPGSLPHETIESLMARALKAAPGLTLPPLSLAAPKPGDGPWERLVREGWSEPLGRAAKAARPDLAGSLAPFAIVCGAAPEKVSALVRASGWEPASEWSEMALRLAFRARSTPMTRIALAHGALISPPASLMAPWERASEELAGLARDPGTDAARRRLGMAVEAGPDDFLPKALESILASPAWSALSPAQSQLIAQRLLDDQFVAHPNPLSDFLPARVKAALKTAGAIAPSPWAYRRAIERKIHQVSTSYASAWVQQTPESRAQEQACAALIKKAAALPELLAPPPAGLESIEPFCLALTESVGGMDKASALIEDAYERAMDQWAASSFGEHALGWTEARSGSTHSAPNAICSLPKTKQNDWSPQAARWVGAFLRQGFDASFKASPKSKSLLERARGSKALAPIYAQAEAIALSDTLAAGSAKKPAAGRL